MSSALEQQLSDALAERGALANGVSDPSQAVGAALDVRRARRRRTRTIAASSVATIAALVAAASIWASGPDNNRSLVTSPPVTSDVPHLVPTRVPPELTEMLADEFINPTPALSGGFIAFYRRPGDQVGTPTVMLEATPSQASLGAQPSAVEDRGHGVSAAVIGRAGWAITVTGKGLNSVEMADAISSIPASFGPSAPASLGMLRLVRSDVVPLPTRGTDLNYRAPGNSGGLLRGAAISVLVRADQDWWPESAAMEPSVTASPVQIRGHTGVLLEGFNPQQLSGSEMAGSTLTRLLWLEQPGVAVMVSGRDRTIAELTDLAESLEAIDPAQWRSMVERNHPPTSPVTVDADVDISHVLPTADNWVISEATVTRFDGRVSDSPRLADRYVWRPKGAAGFVPVMEATIVPTTESTTTTPSAPLSLGTRELTIEGTTAIIGANGGRFVSDGKEVQMNWLGLSADDADRAVEQLVRSLGLPNFAPLDWETIDHATFDANENGSIAPSAVADIHLTGPGDAELVIYSHDPFWNRLIDWAEGDAQPITVLDVLDSKGALISASVDEYFFVMPYKGSTLTMIFSGTSKAEVTRLVRSLEPASENEWARVVGS